MIKKSLSTDGSTSNRTQSWVIQSAEVQTLDAQSFFPACVRQTMKLSLASNYRGICPIHSIRALGQIHVNACVDLCMRGRDDDNLYSLCPLFFPWTRDRIQYSTIRCAVCVSIYILYYVPSLSCFQSNKIFMSPPCPHS